MMIMISNPQNPDDLFVYRVGDIISWYELNWVFRACHKDHEPERYERLHAVLCLVEPISQNNENVYVFKRSEWSQLVTGENHEQDGCSAGVHGDRADHVL